MTLQVPAVMSGLGLWKVLQDEAPESPGVTRHWVWPLRAVNTRGCWLLCGDFPLGNNLSPGSEWKRERKICCPEDPYAMD